MKESLLAKYTNARLEESSQDTTDAEELLDNCGSFGFLRGVRDRALMLQLRKKDGNIRSVGYAWIENADFDPSDGITLLVSGKTVHIKGRNLNEEIRPNVRLYDGITRHRVPWIQEATNAELMETTDTGVIVESIEW